MVYVYNNSIIRCWDLQKSSVTEAPSPILPLNILPTVFCSVKLTEGNIQTFTHIPLIGSEVLTIWFPTGPI